MSFAFKQRVLTCHKGSGIFVTPAIVLQATDSVGISLFLWTFGAIFGLCGLLVWLEFAFAIPKFHTPEAVPGVSDREGLLEVVPRSGAEKNYVIFRTFSCVLLLSPASWNTCTKTQGFERQSCLVSSSSSSATTLVMQWLSGGISCVQLGIRITTMLFAVWL